jgi:hypothetical protein
MGEYFSRGQPRTALQIISAESLHLFQCAASRRFELPPHNLRSFRTALQSKHGNRTRSSLNPLRLTTLRSMPFAFSGLAKMIKVIRTRIRALTETLGGRGEGTLGAANR